jgi:hypothetical protein
MVEDMLLAKEISSTEGMEEGWEESSCGVGEGELRAESDPHVV